MAKFKQVPQAYLFNKLMGFWGNMVKNYRSDVQDDDFFDILRNCFDHDKAVELIEAAYTPEEIKAMSENRSRRSRLDLDDPLDDLFQCLWNHEKGREKCRIILQSIKDYMVAHHLSTLNGVEMPYTVNLTTSRRGSIDKNLLMQDGIDPEKYTKYTESNVLKIKERRD